jgi:hypothetical protein
MVSTPSEPPKQMPQSDTSIYAAWEEFIKADHICRAWAGVIPVPREFASSLRETRGWLWGHPLDRAKLERRCKARAVLRRLVATRVPEAPPIASRAEIEAEFEELGLPMGLIDYLQRAPAPLDPGEDPDPYGLHKREEAGVPVDAKDATP